MDKLYSMQVFSRVVEKGSFTAAAIHLDATVCRVSRTVSALEQTLSTRLLQRSTRSLALTDSGRRYYSRCKQILSDLETAEAEARDATAEPQGTLRVHAAPGLGQMHLIPAVIAYRERYPEVAVDMRFSVIMPDMIEEKLDVSVLAATSLPDSRLIGQTIGDCRCILVASPSYICRRAPRTPEDMAGHSYVRLNMHSYPRDEWRLSSQGNSAVLRPPAFNLTVNDLDAVAVALRAGSGIGFLPYCMAMDDIRAGTLVRVLPDYCMYPRKVFAVYPSHRFLEAKVRRFVEVLKDTVGRRLAAQADELGVSAAIKILESA